MFFNHFFLHTLKTCSPFFCNQQSNANDVEMWITGLIDKFKISAKFIVPLLFAHFSFKYFILIFFWQKVLFFCVGRKISHFFIYKKKLKAIWKQIRKKRISDLITTFEQVHAISNQTYKSETFFCLAFAHNQKSFGWIVGHVFLISLKVSSKSRKKYYMKSILFN